MELGKYTLTKTESLGASIREMVQKGYERGFREGVESAFKDLKPFLTAEQRAAIVEHYKKLTPPTQ